jgi:hypothetical protein
MPIRPLFLAALKEPAELIKYQATLPASEKNLSRPTRS